MENYQENNQDYFRDNNGLNPVSVPRFWTVSNNDRLIENDQCPLFIKQSSIEIEKKIGHGSNATIFRANFIDKSIPVAVKEENLTKNIKALSKQNQEILNEVEQMAQLNHENVIKFYGYCPRQNDTTWIIMELAGVGSLRKFLNECKEYKHNIPEWMKLDWLKQIARGVNFLHSHGIIHRDLKCDNIVFNKYPTNNEELNNSVLKIIDISRDDGTPTYMSPEALEGKYDEKSDAWSFGVIAWEIFTEDDPSNYFQNIYQVAQAYSSQPIKTLPLPEDINKSIENLIMKCWHPEKEKRPNFTDIIEKLEKIELDFDYNTEFEEESNLEIETTNNYQIDEQIVVPDLVFNAQFNQNIHVESSSNEEIRRTHHVIEIYGYPERLLKPNFREYYEDN